MYCSNCGNQLQQEDMKCQSCGARRTPTVEPTSPSFRKWHWLVPLLTFLLTVGSLGGYAFAEHDKTEAADKAFEKGEHYALDGKYEQAKQSFHRALELRANFAAAEQNMALVDVAMDVEQLLHKAEQYKKDNHFDKAVAGIKKVDDMLSDYSGPLVDRLHKRTGEVRIDTNVAQLSYEMKDKSTIEELEPILVRAEKLNIPEAKQIAEAIRAKIADFAYTMATDLLKDKQFSAAVATVTKGLTYEPKNEKLLNLKTTIQSEQEAFEEAEQNRIEQALLAASEEKEYNLNNAIKVTDIKASLNETGDVVVSGQVTSNATVPVTSIMISYTLYTKDGEVFGENEAYVYPDVLYPGETGSFEYTHYLVNEELDVKMNEATWYLK